MAQSRTRKFALLGVSLAVTTAFIVWFIAQQDWSKIGQSFREARSVYVLFAVLPIIGVYLFRVLRWKILMTPVKELSFVQLLAATLIGFTARGWTSR